MSNADEKYAKAEETLERAQRHRDRVLRIKTAEAEIPSIWDTGQVSQASLAKQYGISPMTVKRILQNAGRTIRRVRKLTDEERAEVGALLKSGENVDHIAQVYQVSRNTIRRTGLDLGVLKKGVRKPRRSDEEYEIIREWDTETRLRFNGSGLYNLGLGLRQYEARKKQMADATTAAEAAPLPDVAFIDTPDTIDESAGGDPNHPLNQGSPVNDGPPPEAEPSTTEPEPNPDDEAVTAPTPGWEGNTSF